METSVKKLKKYKKLTQNYFLKKKRIKTKPTKINEKINIWELKKKEESYTSKKKKKTNMLVPKKEKIKWQNKKKKKRKKEKKRKPTHVSNRKKKSKEKKKKRLYTWRWIPKVFLEAHFMNFPLSVFSLFWRENFLVGPERKHLSPSIYFPSFPPN